MVERLAERLVERHLAAIFSFAAAMLRLGEWFGDPAGRGLRYHWSRQSGCAVAA